MVRKNLVAQFRYETSEHTLGNQSAPSSYGQFIGATDAVTIFVVDIEPLFGAWGSAGAHATIGLAPGLVLLHGITNGEVVSVYVAGGKSIDQKTGSGLTVVGDAEKVPVATNWICCPLTVWAMFMD